MKMSPFARFVAGLRAAKADFNESIDELTAFAEIMARKSNTLELDDDGMFYITASGTLEDIIATMENQLSKLKRIKHQKDHQ